MVIRVMAQMELTFDDADPVAYCACGWHTHGDSVNDAVLAWTSHLTGTNGRTPCQLGIEWTPETDIPLRLRPALQ